MTRSEDGKRSGCLCDESLERREADDLGPHGLDGSPAASRANVGTTGVECAVPDGVELQRFFNRLMSPAGRLWTSSRISSATTAAPSTGLLRHASHPASKAIAWWCCDLSAVTATIAVFRVRSSPRRTRATLKPLMPGSIRSSTTPSGSKRLAFSIPVSPSAASITRNPSVASSAAKSSRSSSVSSMTRIQGAPRPGALRKAIRLGRGRRHCPDAAMQTCGRGAAIADALEIARLACWSCTAARRHPATSGPALKRVWGMPRRGRRVRRLRRTERMRTFPPDRNGTHACP